MGKHLLIPFFMLCYACGKGQVTQTKNGQDFEGTLSKRQADLVFENTKNFPDKTEVAIAIIENGESIFYGVNRQNDTLKTVVNHQKVFEIGSITKVFTATLLANLVVDGKVSLDDDIASYLDIQLKGSPKITFEQLANHTSGASTDCPQIWICSRIPKIPIRHTMRKNWKRI